jgi:hypothetical protein
MICFYFGFEAPRVSVPWSLPIFFFAFLGWVFDWRPGTKTIKGRKGWEGKHLHCRCYLLTIRDGWAKASRMGMRCVGTDCLSSATLWRFKT